MGKAAVGKLIAKHRGSVGDKVRGQTDILIIGDLPGKTKVNEAEWHGLKISTLTMLDNIVTGNPYLPRIH